MFISSKRLIDDFIEKVYPTIKDKFPEMSRAEVVEICEAQFRLMKRVMDEDNFSSMRLTYLFSITTTPSKLMRGLKTLYTARWRMSKAAFEKKSKIFLDHIKDHPTKFSKYKKEILSITGRTLEEIEDGDYRNYREFTGKRK